MEQLQPGADPGRNSRADPRADPRLDPSSGILGNQQEGADPRDEPGTGPRMGPILEPIPALMMMMMMRMMTPAFPAFPARLSRSWPAGWPRSGGRRWLRIRIPHPSSAARPAAPSPRRGACGAKFSLFHGIPGLSHGIPGLFQTRIPLPGLLFHGFRSFPMNLGLFPWDLGFSHGLGTFPWV